MGGERRRNKDIDHYKISFNYMLKYIHGDQRMVHFLNGSPFISC